MTTKAREVLDDCRLALSMLEEEVDARRWRVLWAAAVALIRAVGHVLDKADGADDTVLRQVAAAAFKKWKGDDPGHTIFREFIERERNNLLKEYSSDVHPLAEVAFAIEVTARSAAGGKAVTYTDVAHIGENMYRPMLDGPWEGDDAREVLTEAIEWWQSQPDEIDEEVERRRGKPR
jgi:hypothetical protein